MAVRDVEIDTFYEDLWAHVQPESSRRLLVAALEAFAAHGFAGSTTREIAEAAGMSPANLYVHYRSKSALLFEISRIGHEGVLAAIGEAARDAATATESLRVCVEVFVVWHARFHTLGRVCQYELKALDGPQKATIAELRHATQQQLEGILRAGVESAEFDIEDLRGTARAILSLGIDVARWFTDDGTATPEDLAHLYADLTLRMVGAGRRA